jgi:ABC-type enterochelin transport system permease subunit
MLDLEDMIMKDKTKYLLIGIVIGIIIGIVLFYLLTMFRIIQSFRFFGPGNYSGNFSGRFNRSEIP